MSKNYYDLRDPKKEDTAARDTAREVEALEREEDSRSDGKAFNVCKGCGHMLFHANMDVAQKCGKLA
jgi:ubiquitin